MKAFVSYAIALSCHLNESVYLTIIRNSFGRNEPSVHKTLLEAIEFSQKLHIMASNPQTPVDDLLKAMEKAVKMIIHIDYNIGV